MTAAVFAGCLQRRPEPAPPPPAPKRPGFSEESIRPPTLARIEILGFRDTLAPDKTHVLVKGTLVNRGYATTLELRVKITAVDEHNRVIDQVEAIPSNEQVPPGGKVKFSATLPKHPEVVRYQVEAFAR